MSLKFDSLFLFTVRHSYTIQYASACSIHVKILHCCCLLGMHVYVILWACLHLVLLASHLKRKRLANPLDVLCSCVIIHKETVHIRSTVIISHCHQRSTHWSIVECQRFRQTSFKWMWGSFCFFFFSHFHLQYFSLIARRSIIMNDHHQKRREEIKWGLNTLQHIDAM